LYDDDLHRFYINNLEANVLVDTCWLENNIEKEDVKIKSILIQNKL